MTQMVTRCPKCATAFRITSTQLESAKGAVRCGSCLHIFKAQDYLVKSAATETVNPAETAKAQQSKPEPIKTEPAKAEQLELEPIQTTETVIAEKSASAVAPTTISPAIEQPLAAVSKPATPEHETTTTAKPVIDKAKALEDEDDVLISDDMDKTNEKEGYEFDGFIDIDLHPKQTVSLFEREIRYDTPEDDDDKEDTDESWAEELLDDDEETLHQLKKAPPPLAKEPIINSDDLAQAATPEDPAEQSSRYAGPVFSLVSENTDDITEEHKDEHGFSEAFLQATRPPETATSPAADSSAFAAALFDTSSFDAEETEPEEKTSSKRPVKSPKMRAFDTSRAALLMNIMPAPVEFTAKRMRRWYQQKLWPTLSVLMAILLFFQVAYFKFDYFSRVEPTRTAYLFACPLFGCDVPPLVDIQEIETTNLIVRNHPQIAEALLVDAILINKAPFEQPFPDLILSFSKIDETPVASRRFTPKEYLGGELAGMKYIPERQPVHISLEIADPGSEAVNYTLTAH